MTSECYLKETLINYNKQNFNKEISGERALFTNTSPKKSVFFFFDRN